jgi:hypothetical protein
VVAIDDGAAPEILGLRNERHYGSGSGNGLKKLTASIHDEVTINLSEWM